MRQTVRPPFLVAISAAAGLLALLLLFVTVPPPTGARAQYRAVDATFQAQRQSIDRRFQDRNAALRQINPADRSAVVRARGAMLDQYQRDTDANNRRWRAGLGRILHTLVVTDGLRTAAWALLALSLVALSAAFLRAVGRRRARA